MKAAEAQDYPFLRWQRSTDPLDPPNPPHYINSTAISNDGSRVIAGTFYHYYPPGVDPLTAQQTVELIAAPGELGVFATYCFNGDGEQLWLDAFNGYEGVYTVAISGNGKIGASGGWFKNSPYEGFIRAYDVDNTSPRMLEFKPPVRVNSLALSHDGSTLVAGADKLYIFQQAGGEFPTSPVAIALLPPSQGRTSNNVQAVAITYDGRWIVAGDLCGNVYLIENNDGTLSKPYIWQGGTALYTIHSVAMSANGAYFAVAGSGSTVYVFDPGSVQMGPLTYAGTYTLDTGGRVGWVAINAEGSILSVVGNKKTAADSTGGAVVLVENDQGTLTKIWETETTYNPNCASMDANATYVCVADGYKGPGSFSLFDGKTGNRIWQYPTPEMNWPMFMSADGSGIAAGTDEGMVFYFTPQSS